MCLGLVDEGEVGGAGNTDRFTFIDPDLRGNEDFFNQSGVFPWGKDRPDSDDQFCVE